MKKFSNSWSVLLYVLFMLNIAVILWLVVSNNSFIYSSNLESQAIKEKLHTNIYNKSEATMKLAKSFNSNWNWFSDNISCPANVVMSWSTNSGSISTITLEEESWEVYCKWTYLSDSFGIFFDKTYSTFVSAYYKTYSVNLSAWVWETTFWDADNTLISFNTSWLWWIDDIDDDLNSDNYNVMSTWTILTGEYYPWDYQDDDVTHRKKIFWFLEPYSDFYNIFFNNQSIIEFIDDNTNNDDDLNVKLWDVDDWLVILGLEWPLDVKLVKFNKGLYDSESLLSADEIYNWSSLIWYWYLNLLSWALSMQENISWNEFVFDFKNNYYWIFLKNNSPDYVSFNLSAETQTWTWIYINPVQDDGDDILYLWSDIIIDKSWEFISDQFITRWLK